jgi:predicted nucleic acid-binding protein
MSDEQFRQGMLDTNIRVTAAVIAAGHKPRGRAIDLMIAATAIAAHGG